MNSQHKWPVTRKIFPFDDVTRCRAWMQTAFIRFSNSTVHLTNDGHWKVFNQNDEPLPIDSHNLGLNCGIILSVNSNSMIANSDFNSLMDYSKHWEGQSMNEGLPCVCHLLLWICCVYRIFTFILLWVIPHIVCYLCGYITLALNISCTRSYISLLSKGLFYLRL